MPAAFACVFIALYVGHHVADHWVQTGWQALNKSSLTWTGRRACASHVASLTATKALFLLVTAAVVDLHLSLGWTAGAFLVDAVSHYWADRRRHLKKLARAVGKGGYWTHCTVLRHSSTGAADTGPGTGAFHLDQSWHFFWIGASSLFIAAMS